MKLSLTTTIAVALVTSSATSFAAPMPEGISRRARGGKGVLGALFGKAEAGSSRGGASLVGTDTAVGSRIPSTPPLTSARRPSALSSTSISTPPPPPPPPPARRPSTLSNTSTSGTQPHSQTAAGAREANEVAERPSRTGGLDVGTLAMVGVQGYSTYASSKPYAAQAPSPASNSTASHRRSFVDLYYTN